MRDGNEFVEKTERNYALDPEGTLTIDADYGSVRIESWRSDEVDILVEKRYKGHRDERARQTFEHLKVETSHQENEVGIRVDNQNEGRNGTCSTGFHWRCVCRYPKHSTWMSRPWMAR